MTDHPPAPRRIRILVILLAGTIVSGLVIGVSLPSRGGYEYPWTYQVRDWCDEIKYHLTGRRPSPASLGSCIANLKQIDGAKATWALEQHKVNTDVPTATDLFGPAAYIRDRPVCPGGGTYTIESVMQKPVCSLPHRGHTL